MLARGPERALKTLTMTLLIVLLTLLAVRIYDTERGPPLDPWHQFISDEWHADRLDHADWTGWMQQESRLFDRVKT